MMYCSLQVRYLASRWFAFYTDICSKCDCFGGVVLGNSSYLLCSLRKNLWEKLSSCFREKDKFSSSASNYQSLSLKINFWVQLRSREHTILVCPVFKAEFMNSNFRLINLQNIYILENCDGDQQALVPLWEKLIKQERKENWRGFQRRGERGVRVQKERKTSWMETPPRLSATYYSLPAPPKWSNPQDGVLNTWYLSILVHHRII